MKRAVFVAQKMGADGGNCSCCRGTRADGSYACAKERNICGRVVRLDMGNELYFSLEQTVYSSERRVKLASICSVTGVDTQPLDSVEFKMEGDALTVTAFEAAKKLMDLYPGYSVNSLGADTCSIFLRHKQSATLKTLKAVILCIVMFFGGAVAIMTFHEDVNMRSVHSSIYAFFNGGAEEESLVVSIPYTIGVALGFITLFGLFSRKKKAPPTVLDIDIHEYEQTLRDYLSTKSKRPSG